MKLVWADSAWEEYLYWQARSPETVQKINALMKDTQRSPFRGLGKPEPLKGPLQGWWSRRITGEHRLVYRIAGSDAAQSLEIAHCCYHY